MPSEDAAVLFGEASNPAVIQSSGITDPSAIFIAYEEAERVSAATARLRSSFPSTPIYTRAHTRSEAQSLKGIGATEVVIEADELPRSTSAFVWSTKLWTSTLLRLEALGDPVAQERLKRSASVASGVTPDMTNRLFELFQSMDQDLSGRVSANELANLISKTNAGVHSDDEVEEMLAWINDDVVEPLDVVGFCRFYAKSSPLIKRALSDACAI